MSEQDDTLKQRLREMLEAKIKHVSEQPGTATGTDLLAIMECARHFIQLPKG